MEANFFNQTPPSPPPPQATIFTPPKPPSKGINAKSVIVVAVLVLVLGGLVLGFDKARSFLSKAAGDGCEPENAKETNLTATSVEIVFSTNKACQAEVNYGISQDGMLLQVPEAMASLNHRIRLSPLLPSTTYYYRIKVEGRVIELTRSFLTLATQALPTKAPVVPSNFSIEDFTTYFGTANPTFDIDKNGVVNSLDWQLYQKK